MPSRCATGIDSSAVARSSATAAGSTSPPRTYPVMEEKTAPSSRSAASVSMSCAVQSQISTWTSSSVSRRTRSATGRSRKTISEQTARVNGPQAPRDADIVVSGSLVRGVDDPVSRSVICRLVYMS